MNWLSQMILTEIDLAKMYPADKPREYVKPKRATKNQDNFEIMRAKRESQTTLKILKALGNEAMTARQLSDALGGVKKDTMNAQLRRMLEYGYVEKYVPPSGQGITWKAIVSTAPARARLHQLENS